jgi:exopolyphosphatase/guanosine-5'-triphosphate,3'-diphosphate pyrophosphatase
MRLATIDLGSNTVRLLVADVEPGAPGWQVIEADQRVTRLGEGLARSGRLGAAPAERTTAAVAEYVARARRAGAEHVAIVATSAVREAANRTEFVAALERVAGERVRVVSGEEEAALTLAGALGGLDRDPPPGATTLVFDIGGGSTELIGGGHRISTELGSVRLTERFLRSDPPTEDELDALGTAVRSALADAPETLTARRGIGVAGTITSLAALDLGLVEYDRNRVHGHRLGDAAVRAQLERLAALPLAQRRAVPGLEPERAPVIVAGAIILREVMRHFGLAAIEASERDILYGIALEAAALPEPVEGDAPPGAYTCC